MRPYYSTLLAAVTLLTACGSSDSSSQPADTEAATTAVEASTTASPTTEAPTTTAPAEPRTFDPTKILHEGILYTAGDVAIGTEITFTATDKSRYSNNLPGFFSVQSQASGDETLLSLGDLSTAFVFKNPLDDLRSYGGDNAALLAASEPVPEDFFAYFSNLPGVTVGPITDTEFAGFAARSMSYQVGDFDGVSCSGVELCLLTTFQPSGLSYVYYPGDHGVLYIFEVAGRRILADMTGYDGAAEFIATLKIGA